MQESGETPIPVPLSFASHSAGGKLPALTCQESRLVKQVARVELLCTRSRNSQKLTQDGKRRPTVRVSLFLPIPVREPTFLLETYYREALQNNIDSCI